VSALLPIQRAFQLHTQGNLDAAKKLYLSILKKQPANFDARQLLGVLLSHQGQNAEALKHFEAALKLNPRDPGVWLNTGNAFAKLGRSADAMNCFDKALTIRPDYPEAHNNRGNAMFDLGLPNDALACFDKALAMRPAFPEAHNGRANTLSGFGRYAEAAVHYEKVVAARPDIPEALSGLVQAAKQTCDWPTVQRYLPTLDDHIRTRKSLVGPIVSIATSSSPELQRLCAEAFVRTKCPVVNLQKPRRGKGRDRIRIAYISTDFREHAVALQIAELFELHDRSRFEVTGISIGADDGSAVRRQLLGSFDHVVDAFKLTDDEVAVRLRQNECDILVDLNGHTQGARLGILAQRAAPLQVAYLGFAGTMGAGFIDYVIADPWVVPLDQQPHFAEQIVHLPHSYMVNDRRLQGAAETPSRAQAGLPDMGFVFCCFNTSYKITSEVFEVWMRLLTKVDGSVLWLRRFNDVTEQNLRREACARGVDASRIVFAERADLPEHLARHRLADLFLDTWPFNSHSTGSATLWAGLPMLTFAGTTFAGRVGASLLAAVGMPELIAASIAD
jgi:protein O-GlcNAc transferase